MEQSGASGHETGRDRSTSAEQSFWRTRTHAWAALVAAVVILATILFVPKCNRLMRDRQVRGIQHGALVDLMLIAEKEAAFKKANGVYTTDLKALGIAPKRVLYKFGFVTASAAGASESVDPSRKDLDALLKSDPKLKIEYSPLTKLKDIEFDKLASYCPDCTAGPAGFKAVAAANLDDDPVLDVWTIDETGRVTHVVNDL